jgi:hypothetical protein
VVYCSKCGALNADSSIYCSKCGAQIIGASTDNEETPRQPILRLWRAVFAFLFALIWAFPGAISLFTRQYASALLYFAAATLFSVLAYSIYRYNFQVRLRFALAGLFISWGAVFIYFNEVAVGLFAFPILLAAPLLATSSGVAILMGVITLLVICLTIAVWLAQKNPWILSRSLPRHFANKRQSLGPLVASAVLLFFSYIWIISGIRLEYAIPIVFLAMGVFVLKGLRRFAVTAPAIAALLSCMLIFGVAAAGTFTVTFVQENRYISIAQAPDAKTVNLTVNTLEGDIRVYFTDDNSQICQIAFVKEYGPVQIGRSFEFHSKSNYNDEPASVFNYTIEKQQVNITAISRTTLVNITLNQNLRCNLNFFTYFGGIKIIAPPGVDSIQSTNLTSKWGYVEYRWFAAPLRFSWQGTRGSLKASAFI